MSSTPLPIYRPVTQPISIGSSATSLQDTLQSPGNVNGVFAPQRPVAIISTSTTSTLSSIQQQLSDLQDTVSGVANSAALPAAPAIVTNLSAVASPFLTAQGTLQSLVSVSFTNTDLNFASANVFLTGYSGSTTPALATNGTESPISFLAEITGETVTVTVVALNSAAIGQPISSAPTTTVTLGSVTEAPPPPSIAQGLTTTAVGNSFAWNIEGGLLADVISGYNVYRATTNTFPGASGQIQHFAQPSTQGQGTIEFDDTLPSSTTTYFYWVTAVNSSSLESTPTSAGTATGFGTPQQVTNLDPVQEPFTNADGSISELVAVAFDFAVDDPFSNSAEVWFLGYKQNPNWQIMAQGGASPIQFECDLTNELVMVAVTAVSANSVPSDAPPFALAPQAPLALNGVPEAPPYPSIAASQSALANSSGWQFSINVLGGLLGQTIAGYRVYHSDSNEDFTPGAKAADYYTFIAQPPTNSGPIVVQEFTGDILFYGVSAISTTGLESEINSVPFVYVDPNAPSPPIPSPVTTTSTFTPTTLLNGWAAGQHVQYQPSNPGSAGPNPPGLGTAFGPASQTVLPFTNPQAAFDGNQSTAAVGSQTHNAAYMGCVWSFAAPSLPAGATVTAASLNITSNVQPTSGPVAGEGSLWYSLDGGSTWTSVYIATSIARATTTDTVTLPTTQNFASVQIMGNAHAHDDLLQSIFEISLSITTSSASGPGQVVGASISLVSNDVELTWPGLLPTNRTDVTGYDIIRVVHGGGFAHGNVQATIAFVSGQTTYTWSDTQGHDSTFDYFIAAVGTGGIGIPSNVLNLGGASSLIYTSASGAIATVDSLRPAQASADRTASNVSAGIAGQGALATQSEVALATQVSGQLPLANHATSVIQGSTGLNRNLVPDSDIKFGQTYWSLNGHSIFSIGQGSPFGISVVNPGNNFYVTNFPAGTFDYMQSSEFSLIAGQTYTLSAYMDNEGITAGSMTWNIYEPTITTRYASLGQAPQASSRVSTTFLFQPAGVTNGTSVKVVLIYDTTGATTIPTFGYVAYSGSVMVQEGSVATAYQPSLMDDATGYLVAGTAAINFGSSIHSGTLPYNNAPVAVLTALGPSGSVNNLGGVAAAGITPIAGLMPAEQGSNVTSHHVLTAVATATNGSTASGTTAWTAIPGLAFSATTTGPSDVYNFYLSISLQGSTVNNSLTACIGYGPNTPNGSNNSNLIQISVGENPTVIPPISAVFSLTGLPAGTNTLTFYVIMTSGGGITVVDDEFGSSTLMCQRIF